MVDIIFSHVIINKFGEYFFIASRHSIHDQTIRYYANKLASRKLVPHKYLADVYTFIYLTMWSQVARPSFIAVHFIFTRRDP